MEAKEAAIAIALIFTLLLGGILGYALGIERVHKEAVANRQGHWTIVDGSMGVPFRGSLSVGVRP